MTDQFLTNLLAERILGWHAMPDRYTKSARAWLPKWRFQPLARVEDAFQLLEASANSYRLEAGANDEFSAEVRVAGAVGEAVGQQPARTITLAVARAHGLDIHQEAAGSVAQRRNNRPSRSNRNA